MSQGGPTRASAMMSGVKGRSPAPAPKPTGAAQEPAEPGDVDNVDDNKPDAGE
jgi:hypothetical protein